MNKNSLTALKKQADDLRNSGKEEEAIKAYKNLITLYTEAGDFQTVGWAMQQTGVSYMIASKFKEAISWQKKAIKQFQQIGDLAGVGNALRDIGLVYTASHKYKQAITYFLKSRDILKKAKNEYAALGITMVKLAQAEIRLGKIAQAKRHFEKGLRLIQQQGQWFFESTAYFNMSEFYMSHERYDVALEYLEKGRHIIEDHQHVEIHTRRLAQLYGLAAFCLVKLNRIVEAKNYFHKADVILKDYEPGVRKPVEEDIKYQELKKLLRIFGVSAAILINIILGERV